MTNQIGSGCQKGGYNKDNKKGHRKEVEWLSEKLPQFRA
jgi:hypothetical protein